MRESETRLIQARQAYDYGVEKFGQNSVRAMGALEEMQDRQSVVDEESVEIESQGRMLRNIKKSQSSETPIIIEVPNEVKV